MKTVQFLKNEAPYAKGDIAGFEDKFAQKLIEQGIAKEYSRTDDKSDKKK